MDKGNRAAIQEALERSAELAREQHRLAALIANELRLSTDPAQTWLDNYVHMADPILGVVQSGENAGQPRSSRRIAFAEHPSDDNVGYELVLRRTSRTA